jgi:hypothetical protein
LYLVLSLVKNDQDYNKSNCQWATRKVASNNRRDSLINRPHALTEFLGGQMLKSRWESVLFSRNGKPKRKMTPEGWFAYCVQKAGGVPQLAELMGVSRQTVHGSWKGRFPDKHVVQAEKVFGVPRAVLAPHLFE